LREIPGAQREIEVILFLPARFSGDDSFARHR
jgi:hypothetical protein